MEPILAALAEQHAELDGLLTELDATAWEEPSACAGWSVADVVLHLAQTDEMAIASLAGRLAEHVTERARGIAPTATIDEGVDAMVAHERGAPGPAVAERWRSSAGELRAAFDAVDLRTRVTWVAGELAARTLATTRLAEAWIHTGDIAGPLGIPLPAGERLEHVARLAWRTLPYAFARAGQEMSGPVAFELRSPSGGLWSFRPDGDPATTVRGDGVELCLVAARRLPPADTTLEVDGPDGSTVLELIRTYA